MTTTTAAPASSINYRHPRRSTSRLVHGVTVLRKGESVTLPSGVIRIVTTPATVADHLRESFGIRVREEGTGGGCTALVARLEGGAVLVLGDGNQASDVDTADAREHGAAVLFASEDTWGDGGEPIAVAYPSDHADGFLGAVRALLSR